ncbi:TPA: hypothetical protein VKD97_000957 [Streptococcus pyogenes]|nr:hypothetical protein [Streptococcus pyogenes]HER0744636.1 hypothetical protein [Streptococcus pyogenes]HER2983559.1 hypothetical protein [Streptococcus pyogenes]HER2985480.1 hypothetical protein [Streptococcus pyogenes]HER3613216.1 hypothetical protein [Streptococcus pyogenes]
MKTKSKRFLNLATLCLVLLGSTLLVTYPVKATETPLSGYESTEQALPKSNQVTETLHSEGDLQKIAEKSDDGYKLGYQKGYEAGRKEDASENPDENKLESKSLDYISGYYAGYYRGWDETNKPFQTLLEDIYRWLWEIFFKP